MSVSVKPFIIAGYFIGRYVAGTTGSIFGVCVCAGVYAAIQDVLEGHKDADGLIVRHRDTWIRCCFAILGLLGALLINDAHPWSLVGIAVGTFLGDGLVSVVGEAGKNPNSVVQVRLDYLSVLATVVRDRDGDLSDRIQGELRSVSERIFADCGVRSDYELEQFLNSIRTPLSDSKAAENVAVMPPEDQYSLLCDALRITYSYPPVVDEQRGRLRMLLNWTGVADDTPLRIYDRAFRTNYEVRKKWLNELGLKLDSTVEQIEAAYREAAKRYHPDRLATLPEDLLVVANARMAAINLAYQNLKKHTSIPATIYFRPKTGNEPLVPVSGKPIVCRCWICEQVNRIPAQADFYTARCRVCHALLCMLEEPS